MSFIAILVCLSPKEATSEILSSVCADASMKIEADCHDRFGLQRVLISNSGAANSITPPDNSWAPPPPIIPHRSSF